MDLYSQTYFVIALCSCLWSGNRWHLVFAVIAGNNYSGLNVQSRIAFFISFFVTHCIPGVCLLVINVFTMCYQDFGPDLLGLSLPSGKGLWKVMFGAVATCSFPSGFYVVSAPHCALHHPNTSSGFLHIYSVVFDNLRLVWSSFPVNQQRSVFQWSQAVNEAQTWDWKAWRCWRNDLLSWCSMFEWFWVLSWQFCLSARGACMGRSWWVMKLWAFGWLLSRCLSFPAWNMPQVLCCKPHTATQEAVAMIALQPCWNRTKQ